MRTVIAILVVLLIVLQYRLWVGDGSMAEVHQLNEKIEAQKAELAQLNQRNRA